MTPSPDSPSTTGSSPAGSDLPARVDTRRISPPCRAVAELYNAWLTGLILGVTLDAGREAAGELVFRVYRRHHEEKFLSSLEKLGIAGDPPAVLCARYHYLSNSIGGVRVEMMVEHERKAWVRFRHPRWIYQGAAICGVPIEVSRGMLRGWYARNGVSLGNPRLGFVCTSEDMDGQYGLAGYFLEYDRDLAPGERLRFAPGERPPPFDPARAPVLDRSTWPPERLERASRNYAMAPMRLALPLLAEQLGSARAAATGRQSARLIGLQLYEQMAELLADVLDAAVPGGSSAGRFAAFLATMAKAQGDEAHWEPLPGGGARVRQRTWRLMRGQGAVPGACFEAWNGLWEGALLTHDRLLDMRVTGRLDRGDPAFEWEITPLPEAPVRF